MSNCIYCGKNLSRKEYTRCKPCFAKLRKGKFVKKQVKYYAVHKWIRVNFGSAYKCENDKCEHESNAFEWSLLRGNKLERKRKNFWQLCKKCHNLYDNVYLNRKRDAKGKFISN